MKKSIVFLFLAVTVFAHAQVTIQDVPKSQTMQQLKSTVNINSISLQALDIEKCLAEDKENDVENRYSIYSDYNIDVKKEGSSIQTEDGTLWFLGIESGNALSLSLIFSSFRIPEEARLFLYNAEQSVLRGAFSSVNNKLFGGLALADFPGEKLILEYFEPFNALFEGELVIGKVGSAYRNVNDIVLKSATNEELGINCYQGRDYQLEKHAVAKMTFNVGDGGYLCTGALINNTQNDGTPYFLTANHCLSTEASANSLVAYFNYESESCDGTSGDESQTISGSTLKATNDTSDFTLLELSENIPISYRPYFAGWNIADTEWVKSGYSIHHPGGKTKRMSVTYDSILSYSYEINWGDLSSEPNTHWLVYFNEGFTEGGSSGSPLFDVHNRIIGQLHGGGSDYDFYGKLNVSWLSGSTNNEQLKSFLDPLNSGITQLDGYYPAGILPEAFFYADFTNVCQGSPISLYNASAFEVDSVFWQITPNTNVVYIEGTNENTPNPIVAFNNSGDYSISLQVFNTSGSDNQVATNYIKAGSDLNIRITALDDTIACFSGFSPVRFYATGADTYQWQLLAGEEYIELFGSDTIKIIKKEGATATESVFATLQVTGYHGGCSDSTIQQIHLTLPGNDFVNQALHLEMGDHGPFTNNCATVEENEPYPVIGDCNTPGEWCDCERGAPYLDNTVWFTFNAPSSGKLTIDCKGFDNQIAVYDANSADDILSGNQELFSIIGASDDYYDERQDFAARINNLIVSPGKKYWLQVDGSACGAIGDFNVNLVPNGSSSVDADLNNGLSSIVIFPNPASTEINIAGSSFLPLSLTLLTIDGKVIMQTSIEPSTSEWQQTILLPSTLKTGFYLVQIGDGNNSVTQKLFINK